MNREQFGRLLRHEGLVDDEQLPPRAVQTPGAMQALSLFGAWLAAWFVLGALGSAALMLMRSDAARVVLGVLMCAGVVLINRRRGPAAVASAFRSQFFTAISLAGAALILSGLVLDTRSWPTMALATTGLSALLWWLNPDPIHRVYMAWSLVFSLAAALIGWGWLPLTVAMLAVACHGLWLRQARWIGAGLSGMMTPLAYACSVALLAVPWMQPHWGWFDGLDVGVERFGTAAARSNLIVSAELCLVLIATLLTVARRWQARWSSIAVMTVALLIVVALTWRMPGIPASLLVWILGMAAGRRLLQSLAIVGLSVYLLLMYYSLAMSLLAKGQLLMTVGVVLLAGFFAMRRLAGPRIDEEAPPHA